MPSVRAYRRSRNGAKAMSLYHPPRPEPAAAASARKRGLLRRMPWEIRLSALAILYLGPPLLVIAAVAFVYYTARIPDPMALRLKEQAPVVRILARDGSLLSERGAGDAYVPIDLLPRHLIDAVIATEDRRFFKHWGLDPSGMLRAAFTNLSQGRVAQGGSTLTQERANSVLAKMVEAGFLSLEESEKAARAMPHLAETSPRGQSGVDYAVDAVLERLPSLVAGPASEVVVETTIDANLQRRAQALVHGALTNGAAGTNAGQAGLVLMDVDGAIRALVGGRSYAESQFNRALKARRQPGSVFKMFVYLAALESGLTPDSTVLDLPILGSGWSPRNEGAGYRGAVTLRDALAQSMNAAAARINMTVGPRKTAAVARRLGIRSELRADASLALGTSEVTLLELTSAYGVLANGGRELDAHIVSRVRTASGQLLFERRPGPENVLVAPEHVAAINDMLSAVLASGTGKRAALPGHPAAGKTGTSQDFRDAWFVGYTAQFVAGVWVGNDDGRAMNKVMGGSLPARLWRDAMLIAHEGDASASMPPSIASLAAGEPRQSPERRANVAPLMPRERIGADFIERATTIVEDPPPSPTLSTGSGWIGTAKDLLRGLGLGPQVDALRGV